ncbi:MAG TPA: Vms1/Ankzf1 family peptidyl-tRNA hydrolase [Actinomycetota bacterium]
MRLRSILSERFRMLRAVQAERPVVVSCYLDTSGRDRPRRPDLLRAAERLVRSVRADADRLDLDRGERSAVDADLDDFLRGVGGLVDRGSTRQLISFSSRSLGLSEQLRLPLPLGDHGAIGRRPMLLPLESALAADAMLGLALTDRGRTRLFLQQLGELEELPGVVDEVPAQTSGGGWAQARLARRADAAAQQHAKRSAEAVYQAFRAIDGLELVLAGPEPAVRELAGRLRSELADRVVAELRLPVGASQQEVSQALERVAAERAAARNAALVRRVTEGAGSPSIAAGLGPVLEALRQHRLATVLAAARMTSPGATCPGCGQLALALECPSCGTATEELDDVIAPTLEEAMRQGATVVVVPGEALETVGGVGAVLRY